MQTGKPHRKPTALDTNSRVMQQHLMHGMKCDHNPLEHQVLEGQVSWVNRTKLRKDLTGGLKHTQPVPTWTLVASTEGSIWEAVPVSCGTTPEEELRRHGLPGRALRLHHRRARRPEVGCVRGDTLSGCFDGLSRGGLHKESG